MKNTFFVILLIAFAQVAFIAAAEEGTFLNDVPASSSVAPVKAGPSIDGGKSGIMPKKVHKVKHVPAAPKGHEYLDHFYNISPVVKKAAKRGKKAEKTPAQKAKDSEKTKKDKLFLKSDAKARKTLNKSSKALRKLIKKYKKTLKNLRKAKAAKNTTEITKLEKAIAQQRPIINKAIVALINNLKKQVTFYRKENRTRHLISTRHHIAHLQRLRKVVNGSKWTQKEHIAELKYRIEKTKIKMQKKKSQLHRLSKQLKSLQSRLAHFEKTKVVKAPATKPSATQTTVITTQVVTSTQTKPATTK